MLCWIKMDFGRLFRCRRYYCCIAGIAGTLFLGGMDYLKTLGDTGTLEECYSVATSSGFVLLCYMLCVVGGGMDYCTDVKNNYIRYTVIRGNIRGYAASKLLVSALGGYLGIAAGQVLFCGMMSAAIRMENGAGNALLSGAGLERTVWDILIFSLLGAVLSVLGLFVTTWVPNIFMGMAAPVLFFYMVITLTNKHWKTEVLMPSCIYFSDSELFGGGIRQFLYAFLVTCCILWLLYRGIFRQMKRGNGYV